MCRSAKCATDAVCICAVCTSGAGLRAIVQFHAMRGFVADAAEWLDVTKCVVTGHFSSPLPDSCFPDISPWLELGFTEVCGYCLELRLGLGLLVLGVIANG